MHDPESVRKKRGSEQSDRYRKSTAPSAPGKAYDFEPVGKKHGSEQNDRYRKSAAPSRVIVTEKARLRALRERRTIPSPSGKSAAPSRVIVTEKSAVRVLREKVRSERLGEGL